MRFKKYFPVIIDGQFATYLILQFINNARNIFVAMQSVPIIFTTRAYITLGNVFPRILPTIYETFVVIDK